MVRFGYLVAQAVIPAFLSFIYIFSRHPLYPEFSRSHAAIGLRPLTDQQVAGFVSKLTMLLVLLSVGAVVLARASRSDDESTEGPLVWADVERQFERVDRRGRRRSDPIHVEPDRPPPRPGPSPNPGAARVGTGSTDRADETGRTARPADPAPRRHSPERSRPGGMHGPRRRLP